MKIQKAKQIQEEFAKKVITKDVLPKISKICAVDVSYRDGRSFCAAVVYDTESLQVIETKYSNLKTTHDYIPGYFMLREAKPILNTLKKLKSKFDVLLIDGHGQLHPRRCGLACYIGVSIQKPTIGVAKRLLCGNQVDSKIKIDGKTLGQAIQSKNRTIFVSVGHMISLNTATKIVKNLIRPGKQYPEPLYLADRLSKN